MGCERRNAKKGAGNGHTRGGVVEGREEGAGEKDGRRCILGEPNGTYTYEGSFK
jgi:hypothetical protein